MSKLIMLDSAELIAEVYDKLLNETFPQSPDLPYLKIHLKNIIDIATYAVVNLIETRSVFPVEIDKMQRSNVTLGEHALGKLFDLNATGINKFQRKTMLQIAEWVESALGQGLSYQVLSHVKSNNHNIWTVVPIGRNIAIVEGEDYRIVKYHELTNTKRPNEDLYVDLNPIIHYLSVKLNRTLNDDNGFYVNPVEVLLEPVVCDLIVTKFLMDSLIRKYPNLELIDDHSPAHRTLALIDAINNFDVKIHKTLSDSIEKILNTYDEYVFRDMLSPDVHYDVSITAGRLTLTPVDMVTRAEQDEDFRLKCLVTALLNGDYLPEIDRKAAEAYYASNSHLFI